MNKRSGTPVAALLALLALPAILAAQNQPAKHRHYTLADLGTFGGPNSNVNSLSKVINERGTVVGGADTADWDPICGCYAFHAFEWHNGVLTDLGNLPGGGNFSFGISINSSGTIAGVSDNGEIDPTTSAEAFVAVLWKNGHIIDLGTFGGSYSLPNEINSRGQAVGGAEDTIADPFNFGGILGLPSPTQWHATLWQNGAMRDLGTLEDGLGSFALNINERGQVAGFSFTNSVINPATGVPTVAPFLWENGQMTNLGTLGGHFGVPNGMNDKGQVIGFSLVEGDQSGNGFLWEKGLIQNLGTLGGGGDLNFSEATAINDNGEIAGHSSTPNDELRGFRWKGGVMTELGAVPGGDCGSNVFSINGRGDIVGFVDFCIDDAPPHAALWETGRPGIDLNTLVPPGSDLELIEAQFINDRGEIAGLAFLPNGDAHAFVLIPKEGNENEASSDTLSQSDAATLLNSSANVKHSRLTPERAAARRARFANRHRGFSLRQPKKDN